MKLFARVVTVGIFGLLNTLPAFGTDGTWTNLTTGVWSDPAQWVDGIVGGGSGSRIDIVPGFGGDRPDDRFLEVPYGDGVTLGSLRYLSGTPQGAIRIYGGPLVFDNPDGYANIQGNNGSLILLSEIHGTDTIQFDSVTLAAPAFHTGDTVVNGGINLYGHTYAATPGEAVTNFLPATRLTLMGNAHLSSLSRGSWGTFSADFSLTEGSRLAVCADVLNRGMGAMIEGEGIAPGTWLKASITEYVFELSQPATATGTFTLNIGAASPASLSLQQLRELAITERGTLEIKNWGALNRWEVDELTGAGTLVKRGDGTLALGIGDRFSGSLEVQGTAEIRGKGIEELELENLTVASGTLALPQPDMTVSANHFVADGSVVKTGAGTLVAATLGAAAKMEVREGHIDLGGGADLRTTCPVGGAWFHVDASRADTLTIESENGIDYVTRWEDADGGAVFATAGTRPFVNTNALNGLPVIDFGSYHYPNEGIQGYGGSLSWSETCWSVRELFIVYSDTEEIAELPGTIAGGFILGGDQYSFHRGLNSSLFISPYAAAQIREGLIEVDGEPRTFDYALPSGFHLIHLRTTGPVSAGAFARDRGLSFGGQRIAEAIVYNYTLPDSAATSIVNYLTGKWFSRVPSESFEKLTVAEGASVSVGGGDSLRIGTLTLDGTLVKTGDSTLSADTVTVSDTGALNIQGGCFQGGTNTTSSLAGKIGLADGAGLAALDGTTLMVTVVNGEGTVVKEGAGTVNVVGGISDAVTALDIRDGTLSLPPGGSLPANAWFHVDASRTDTLTTVTEDGIEYVSRWDDADGGMVHAEAATRPFVNTNVFNGLPVIDFGSYHYPNEGVYGYGGSMSWNITCDAIREIFIVFSDTEDIAAIPSHLVGSFLLGDANSYHFHRGFSRGLFINPYAAAALREGLIEVDGVARASDYALPNGFHLIHLRTTAPVTANAFARDRWLSFGGQRLAEVAVYDRVLTESEAAAATSYLFGKWWLKTNGSESRAFDRLQIAADATLNVVGGPLTVTELSASGTILAETLTAKTIRLTSDGSTIAGFALDGVFSADTPGTVIIDGAELPKSAATFTVATVERCSDADALKRWRVEGSAIPVGWVGSLAVQDDHWLVMRLNPSGMIFLVN